MMHPSTLFLAISEQSPVTWYLQITMIIVSQDREYLSDFDLPPGPTLPVYSTLDILSHYSIHSPYQGNNGNRLPVHLAKHVTKAKYRLKNIKTEKKQMEIIVG